METHESLNQRPSEELREMLNVSYKTQAEERQYHSVSNILALREGKLFIVTTSWDRIGPIDIPEGYNFYGVAPGLRTYIDQCLSASIDEHTWHAGEGGYKVRLWFQSTSGSRFNIALEPNADSSYEFSDALLRSKGRICIFDDREKAEAHISKLREEYSKRAFG